ncbi:MAG: hypothetical protein ACRDT0_07625 [Pseudonocardiaceae bacterium]
MTDRRARSRPDAAGTRRGGPGAAKASFASSEEAKDAFAELGVPRRTPSRQRAGAEESQDLVPSGEKVGSHPKLETRHRRETEAVFDQQGPHQSYSRALATEEVDEQVRVDDYEARHATLASAIRVRTSRSSCTARGDGTTREHSLPGQVFAGFSLGGNG